MTIPTIGVEGGSTKIGLGSLVYCSGLTGPTPVDDFVYYYTILSAYSDETHGYNAAAHSLVKGLTHNDAVMGIHQRSFSSVYPRYYNSHAQPGVVQLAEGTTISLLVIQSHDDGTEVDRGLLTGLTWTQYVDIPQVVGSLLLLSGTEAGVLQEIRDSVKRNY
jgi:hypothetical protein